MAQIEFVEVNGRRRIKAASPATLEPIGEVDVATPDDVRAAVERARKAQPGWAALSFRERGAYMERAVKILLERKDEFVEKIWRDTGRNTFEGLFLEIFPACDSLTYYARRAEKILKEQSRWMHLLGAQKKLRIVYRPLGVAGIIVPWNGPFVLALNPAVQALMAGNAVIIKPSEVTPFAGRLAGELLREAGIPDGVVQTVVGDGATGAALIEAGVNKISFTGSVRTGRKVGEACGRNLIPCTLELGGKDPMVVCADADVERAAGGAVFGGFVMTGQFCCSTERVYVHEAVADDFTAKVVEKVKALRQGDRGEYDMGSMIWPEQMKIIERQMEDAVAKGAKVLTGGRRNPNLKGWFYEPTVLVDVTHDMAIMREETFGPVLPIMRVRSDEEAIRLANDSEYGLSSNVWSKDEAKAIAIAKRIESGSVCVNDSSLTYGACEAPFGGIKTSGVGYVNGEVGLKGYCQALPIIVDRFGQKAEHVWYPYTEKKYKDIATALKVMWTTPLRKLLS